MLQITEPPLLCLLTFLSYITEQNKPTNYSFYTDKSTNLDVPDLDSGTFVYSGRHVHVRNQLLIVLVF